MFAGERLPTTDCELLQAYADVMVAFEVTKMSPRKTDCRPMSPRFSRKCDRAVASGRCCRNWRSTQMRLCAQGRSRASIGSTIRRRLHQHLRSARSAPNSGGKPIIRRRPQ